MEVKDEELLLTDCEAKIKMLKEELDKMHVENCYLQEELKGTKHALHWHEGFRAAVELIFGKRNICE